LPIEGRPDDAAETTEPSVAVVTAYTADVWSNVAGGLQRGTAYLDNLDLVIDVDAERAWGLAGLWLHGHLLYNNAATFSDRYVGDALVISNIDATRALRPFELWIDWRPPRAQSMSVRAGLYDVNSEFDATIARSLFLNSSHGVGHEFAQSGQNGPSIFPVTSLGARFAWQPDERWLVEFAALDGVPGDPERPARTTIDLSADDGALFVGEVTVVPFTTGRVSLGHWRYSADFDDLLATDATGAALRRSDNRGTYVNAEFFPAAASAEAPPRWTAFLRMGVANGHINAYDQYHALGIVWHDAVLPGIQDAVGIALATTRASDDYCTLRGRSGLATDRHEYNLELTWRIPVTEYLPIQPDLQYVINPGNEPGRDDALAIGLRLEMAAGWRGGPQR
jgi:porin